ncbi:MAG: CBO0543 family protein [Clostridia bacterium]
MKMEYTILLASWIITTILLIIFIPRDKIRHAWVIFFFKQFITWIIGLLTVELHLIEYPVRLFSYACRTSFTFEYFVYPAICVLFNLHYPKQKSRMKQFSHYFIFCSVITIIELLIEIYTDLIEYRMWTWYWTWITLFITLYASRKFYLWFFQTNTETI